MEGSYQQENPVMSIEMQAVEIQRTSSNASRDDRTNRKSTREIPSRSREGTPASAEFLLTQKELLRKRFNIK